MPEKAIVSPCSSCTNQRSEAKDGKPACPRRQWIARAEQLAEAGEPIPESLNPVLLTGYEGTDKDGTDSLRNPVYSNDSHHILVWIAKLDDNKGIYDRETGKRTQPHILDPGFDTDYIQCTFQPYSVKDTEANYFMKGAWKEKDLLEVSDTPKDQLGLGEGEQAEFDPVKVNGSAQKVDFPYKYNRKSVDKDLSPRGT
jgi:hypothetical protein